MCERRNIHQRAFSIALTVFYKDLSNDISGKHATTFFNKTVEIVEQPRWVDTEAISMYLTLAAILAGIGAFRTTATRPNNHVLYHSWSQM